MKTNKYLLYFVLSPLVLSLASCEPKALTPEDVFADETTLADELAAENPEGYEIYTLNQFLDTYMTEQGNFWSDTSRYRDRSTADNVIFMYSVDTLPTNGKGIYIRGRVTTDDWSGNFYKAMVIQQVVEGEQQNLRISVDLGSSGGMYQIGQEILIRCNGLAVGRYANQPQLCIPSYNNNIYAMNASQKVGWAPGRIQGSVFRRVTRMIGTPDVSKLKYDELTLNELYNSAKINNFSNTKECMDQIRKQDGRLVIIKGVHFTGQFDDQGTVKECEVIHPDSANSANVFAPTSNNIGYPQGRIITDGSGKALMCSSSEYAKFAYYYLPGANKDGVNHCQDWEGTVTGILGFYEDKASELKDLKNEIHIENDGKSYTEAWKKWSVTPRGIPGIGIADIVMYYQGDPEMGEWTPKEFDPKDYNH
ncbi:MAG: hypothetical protein J5902_00525 [Paludibacteraceae bacterium]|nr:hypothetical protein [Paludibacteraceae bacterium]